MAYKNLVNVNCASITEVFRHLKDWLLARNGIADYSSAGLGWTLHDSSFATDQDAPVENDWLVITSAGENGKQDLYYRILFTTLANSIIKVRGGLYWNAATDAWVKPFYVSGDIVSGPTTGSAFNLYIYGSLDAFSIIIGNGTNLYGRYFGLAADTLHDSTIAITSGAVTSGAGKVITVDSVPASWAVGKTVFIRDLANIEKTTITAISGNDVTMTLANGYSSGAKIARDYSMIISVGGYFLGRGYLQVTHSGSAIIANYAVSALDTSAVTNADPDPMNGVHATDYIRIYGAHATDPIGNYGRFQNILAVSVTGITAGQVYLDDDTGEQWRALSVMELSATLYLFKEV